MSSMPPNKPALLIVEDSASTRELYAAMTKDTFDVIQADGFAAAVEIADEYKNLAVVLCDWQLGRRDGLKVLEAIKNVQPLAVATLVTAHPSISVVQDALNRNIAFRFLQKGSSQSELKEALCDCLSQHRRLISRDRFGKKAVPDFIANLTKCLYTQIPGIEYFSNRLHSLVDFGLAGETGKQANTLKLSTHLVYLGMLRVPSPAVEKVISGEKIPDVTWEIFRKYPSYSIDMFSGVPQVASASKLLAEAFGEAGNMYGSRSWHACVLRSVHDAIWLQHKLGTKAALGVLDKESGVHPDNTMKRALIKAAELVEQAEPGKPLTKTVLIERPVHLLLPGDVTMHNILTRTGELMLSAGSQLKPSTIERLRDLEKAKRLSGLFEITRTVSA